MSNTADKHSEITQDAIDRAVAQSPEHHDVLGVYQSEDGDYVKTTVVTGGLSLSPYELASMRLAHSTIMTDLCY